MKKFKYILIVLALTLLSCTLNQKDEKETTIIDLPPMPILAGAYDMLEVAFDGEMVTGFYSNGTYEGNPNFGCSFYFYGNERDKEDVRKLKINILNPFNLSEKPGEGSFKVHDEENTHISLVAKVDSDDCWDPHLGWTQIAEPPGVGFDLYTKEAWLEIRIVKEEKVYFYTDPNESTKRKAYVIKNDPLFITERKGDWIKATYSSTAGWIKNAETISLKEIGNI